MKSRNDKKGFEENGETLLSAIWCPPLQLLCILKLEEGNDLDLCNVSFIEICEFFNLKIEDSDENFHSKCNDWIIPTGNYKNGNPIETSQSNETPNKECDKHKLSLVSTLLYLSRPLHGVMTLLDLANSIHHCSLSVEKKKLSFPLL